MTFNSKLDNQIMRILKISELRHPIVDTTKGHLALQLRFGEDAYHFILDAVPVPEDTEKALTHILLNNGMEIPQPEIARETPQVEEPIIATTDEHMPQEAVQQAPSGTDTERKENIENNEKES